ncbi:hypothetical protein BZG05_16045 [Salinivibrio kushneri]|uniref:hypothetical protein n=1 Tax=Salinivibrio kushneri TaxID=1908198 RepID=UPI0009892CE6|nr:hypothetical protein [Salinivibrio kushneri]OOE31995.1 hypothetical protein BZG05_16045 [Salinivibrio kushneri]
MARKHISNAVQTELFYKSMRRCALCFGVNNDFNEKSGQIAHLDQDNTNANLDNLVWLCLNHHDSYDGSTRQSKNYTRHEVKHYRGQLYQYVDKLRSDQNTENEQVKKITDSLNCVMKYIPYSHLRRYIEDFPYNFSVDLCDVHEMWRIFKRDNPMQYPFTDRTLNQLIDEFFSHQGRVESLIGARFEYENENGQVVFDNCFESNLSGNKLNINNYLRDKHRQELEQEVSTVKVRYLQSYDALTYHIRSFYPKVNLNRYQF